MENINYSPSKNQYELLIDKARIFINEQNEDAALICLAFAVSIETARPEAYNLIGVTMEILKDIPQAMKFYRAALSFDPSYTPASENLSRAASWRRDGKFVLG